MPYFIKILRYIQKIPYEIQELGMRQKLYKYYEQWTATELHRNHLLQNQIDELIVACIFQTRN